MPTLKRQTLTKVMVEGVKPKASAYRLWDSKVPGLALRVLTSGRSTYEVHWSRNRSATIGVNGVMGGSSCRSTAHAARGR